MSNRQVALLLLVPAVAMAAKSHARRHMWAHGLADDEEPGRFHVHGHDGHGPWGRAGRHGFGAPAPHMFKAMLDEWHRAAHGGTVPTTDTLV